MKEKWWKEAVVYQIYPKSFQDTDGDGVGDIPGIIERLDYLKWLGVSVLWISPVYCSPMEDNGYDISDYYHIDPSFGTDGDMDRLIEEAGKRDMKILMDLVVNHTSDQHPWFQAAISDPDSEYASYYVFQDGVDGNPPDNLRSYFGGPAWERVGDTDRFYFHAFGKGQPDLNWDNPKLREEIYQMMNYWLDKGICGFRVDAIGNIKKNLTKHEYPVDGPDGLSYAGTWIQNQPGIEEFLREMKEKTLEPHNAMTVAEVGVPEELLGQFVGEDGFFSMVFDFSYTDIDVPDSAEWFVPTGWTSGDFKKNLFESQLATQRIGWGAAYLENHDQPRSLNKYIPEEDIGFYSAAMLGTLYMMLRGTPFIYQGQELGMTNIHMGSLEDYDDLATADQYRRALDAGLSEEAAWQAIYRRSRDNSRTPMQWNSGKQAGFTTAGHTWLKVNSNYPEINAEKELADKTSVLHYYRKLVGLRTSSEYRDIVVYGSFVPYETEADDVIAYERVYGDRRLLVANNFGNKQQEVELPDWSGRIVLGNYLLEDEKDGVILGGDGMAAECFAEESDGCGAGGKKTYQLRPYESIIIA